MKSGKGTKAKGEGKHHHHARDGEEIEEEEEASLVARDPKKVRIVFSFATFATLAFIKIFFNERFLTCFLFSIREKERVLKEKVNIIMLLEMLKKKRKRNLL